MRQEFVEKNLSFIVNPNKDDLQCFSESQIDSLSKTEVLYLAKINNTHEQILHAFVLFKQRERMCSLHSYSKNCIRSSSYSDTTIDNFRKDLKEEGKEWGNLFNKVFTELDYQDLNCAINSDDSNKNKLKRKNKI